MLSHITSHFDFIHLKHRANPPSELTEVYISSGIYQFVVSLTGIFLPLYFLNNLGYTLFQVFIFLATITALRALFNYPVGLLIAKIGPKHAMIASFPIAFLAYLFIFLLKGNPWLISLVILTEGLFTALYPAAFHVNLSKGSHDDQRGAEISKLSLYNLVAVSFGPLIGGVIIQTLGFPYLMVVAMVAMALASYPLLLSSEIYPKRKFELARVKLSELKPDITANMFSDVEIFVASTIWAIFVYSFIKSYELLGITKTLMLVVGVISTYLVGKYADHHSRRKMLNFGSTVNGVIEFGRIATRTLLSISVIEIIRGIFVPLKSIPYTVSYYKRADEQPRMEYICVVETAGAVSLTFFMVMVLFVNALYGDFASIVFALAVGALASFGIRMIALP